MKSLIFAILICLGFSDAFAQGFMPTRRLDFQAAASRRSNHSNTGFNMSTTLQ